MKPELMSQTSSGDNLESLRREYEQMAQLAGGSMTVCDVLRNGLPVVDLSAIVKAALLHRPWGLAAPRQSSLREGVDHLPLSFFHDVLAKVVCDAFSTLFFLKSKL